MTSLIPIFRNEINALGGFREGVNIASEFTNRRLKCPNPVKLITSNPRLRIPHQRVAYSARAIH
jgi:hypothetical protein